MISSVSHDEQGIRVISIDLNADLGEGAPYDKALLQVVSSCNVACGGHTGNADSMATTVRLAMQNGVAVGAHPSYPDRDGFGRRSRHTSGDALYESLSDQATALVDIAAQLGVSLAHLKPHGALYNDAAIDADLADIIARVTAELPGEPQLVGLPNSELAQAASRHALKFVAEAFVDRAYAADGKLVARSEAGAVYDDFKQIAAQAVSLATEETVRAITGEIIRAHADTLCIHGDTPGADVAARVVRAALDERGVNIRQIGR